MFEVDDSGLTDLSDQIDALRDKLASIMADALNAAGKQVVDQLAQAAPHGSGGGPPPAGDESGPLAESFRYTVTGDFPAMQLSIDTNQPTKLQFVRDGTGIYGPNGQAISPVEKRALYWQNAWGGHPWMRSRGQRPHDFVSPILQDAETMIADQVTSAISDAVVAALGAEA